MSSLALGVKFLAASGGIGSFVANSAVHGYMMPSGYPMVDGKTYVYRAESTDLTQWEWGKGVYTAATQTLARTTIMFSSNANAAVNFAAAPQVGVVVEPAAVLQFDDAMSLTAAQQNTARSNLSAVGAIRIQKFTASGMYTPSTGMLYCNIECIGGGGGSGGSTAAAGYFISGGGGGGGSYASRFATAATIGASQSVTIGAGGAAGAAGGDSSVGTLCIGKGGGGGATGTSGAIGNGGAGGVAGTGDITIVGQAGEYGLYSSVSGNALRGGNGGASRLGPASIAVVAAGGVTVSGISGNAYGGGAAGASSNNNATSGAGAAGAPGIVIITEFCSQ